VDGYIRVRSRLMRASFVTKDLNPRAIFGKKKELEKKVRVWSTSHSYLLVLFMLYPDSWKRVSMKTYSKFLHPVYALGVDFYVLPIQQMQSERSGLILMHTGIKGQYQRLGCGFRCPMSMTDPQMKLSRRLARISHGLTILITRIWGKTENAL
jgi:hypothetical protein